MGRSNLKTSKQYLLGKKREMPLVRASSKFELRRGVHLGWVGGGQMPMEIQKLQFDAFSNQRGRG